MARILANDDDHQARLLFSEILELAGYDVEMAKDGEEGIELFTKTPADLIILDILMPTKDGLETLQELRRLSPNVKIIAGSVEKGSQSTNLGTATRLGPTGLFSSRFQTKPWSVLWRIPRIKII